MARILIADDHRANREALAALLETVGHEVLTVQWQQGVRRVVWPPDKAERPLVPHRR